MSDYGKRWLEVLKQKQVSGWNIDVHGQAIVIEVPAEQDPEAVKKQASNIIEELKSEVGVKPGWLKFIFYNGKMRFEHILNPELRR